MGYRVKIRKVFLVLILIYVCSILGFGSTIVEAKAPSLNKKSVSIKIGNTYLLKVNATNKKVTWSSSDKKVASVKNGLVTANKTGKAIITAKTGEVTLKSTITVYQPAKKVKITKSSKLIEVGDTFTLNVTFTPNDVTYKKMTWAIEGETWYDDGAVKHVSGNKFKAIEEGTVIITGYQKETNKRYSIKVVIKEALGEFYLFDEAEQMEIASIQTYPGYHVRVSGKLKEENYYEMWYDNLEELATFQIKIKDTKIAKIDQTGQVTGIKEGKTTLILTASNGKTKEYPITISKKPAGLVKDVMIADGVVGEYGTGGYHFLTHWTDSNFAKVDDTNLIAISDNSYGMFQYNSDKSLLTYYEYNKEHKLLFSKNIPMPYPIWGGVLLGDDGYYYMAFGQENKEEDDNKIVYCFVKYDKDFKEIARTNITGGQSHTTVPLDSNGSMALNGTTLVIYNARTRYKADDGLNHQSNIGFVIDTTTMKATYIGAEFPYNHVSHSFSQFIRFDGNNLIYVDHGDAYPRSVVMQFHKNFTYQPPIDDWRNRPTLTELAIINIKGVVGDNFTGTRVGGFELGTAHNIVAGVSIPHDTLTGEYIEYSVKNVYVALVSKDGTKSTLKWLTNFKETGKDTALNLRMIKVNDNKFVLLYQVDTEEAKYVRNSKIVMMVIDSNGDVLQQQEWQGEFNGDIAPIVFDNKVLWVCTYQEYDYNDDEVYTNYVTSISLE